MGLDWKGTFKVYGSMSCGNGWFWDQVKIGMILKSVESVEETDGWFWGHSVGKKYGDFEKPGAFDMYVLAKKMVDFEKGMQLILRQIVDVKEDGGHVWNSSVDRRDGWFGRGQNSKHPSGRRWV